MTDTTPATKKPLEVTISRAKGRPMLSWVGKKTAGPGGRYELPAPTSGSKMAIKGVDMLGEEHVVVVATGC